MKPKSDQTLYRVTIYFQDDAIRRESEAAIHHLLLAASKADASSNSNTAVIAKRALKYRKILGRLVSVDVTSPEFNASEFLGVQWCKIESLRAFCAREDTANPDKTRQGGGIERP